MTAQALTYDSLLSDIQSYAERDDDPFVSQIPRLVMLAENRIASEIRGLGYIRVVSFALNSGTHTYQKPARWRETVSLSYAASGVLKPIYPRQYQYARMYWPDLTQTGVPAYYADYDYEHFIIVPTPNAGYTAELMYHERPEPLSTDNQTNWTTQYAPQLLLYGTLLEAQPFLKRPERMQEFQTLFDRAAQAVLKENMGIISDASMRRNV